MKNSIFILDLFSLIEDKNIAQRVAELEMKLFLKS